MKKKVLAIIGGIVLAAALLGACSQQGQTNSQAAANNSDVQTSSQALQQLQRAQPTPLFSYSQERQTLIAIETAQAQATQTTSFFFNQGVQDPITSCPSVGVPIASTTELTNPQQAIGGDGGGSSWALTSIGQVDPTGVYSGNSTGTYVLCVNADGSNFIQYWEGFVDSVTGPAVWNGTTHQVQLTGPSSVSVKTKP